MTDWLAVCRSAVDDVHGVLEALPTRVEREPVVGAGLGGDDTTAIDRAAEDAILARFRDLDVTIVSEEVGRLGAGATVVVVDPIDGSINAKRGIPFFSISIAVAEGETMDDVFLGFVHDFGTGEEWVGRRGEGAWLNGEPLGALLPKETIDLLFFEATRTRSTGSRPRASRTRRTRARRSRRSTAARRRPPSSSGRPGSRTSGRSRRAAR